MITKMYKEKITLGHGGVKGKDDVQGAKGKRYTRTIYNSIIASP